MQLIIKISILQLNRIMKSFTFSPQIIKDLRNYSKEKFAADLMAGIIVGIVALPLAIAFGIASGVSPETGIITAIIAGLAISLFGGSKVQIGGPTGAFIVIIYNIIQQYGESGLLTATILAGIILLALGFFRLGTIIKYIPYPIIVGFTSGIAITIFTTQIKDLFGLTLPSNPADFIEKWIVYIQNFGTINYWSALVGIVSIFIIAIFPKISRVIPGSLVAIVLMTVGVYALKTYGGVNGIETIGDRFTIEGKLPSLSMPSLEWETIKSLMQPAITIAVLGAIESLLSATVADGVIGSRHNSNQELIGQGIANILSPLFGGIPATGAIARTMTNINNGGKTPIAGVIHAIILLLIFVFLMPLAQYIPMACLAGVLVVVSYNMSGWRTFRELLKNPKSDVSVLLITFFLTVIFDLTVAIEFGLLLACLLFIKRVMSVVKISSIRNEIIHSEDVTISGKEEHLTIPKDVEAYEINGPYFFGIANKFEEIMLQTKERPKIRIIRMRKVPFIDSTGIHNLTSLCEMSRKENIQIVLSGVNQEVYDALKRSGFTEKLHDENICKNIHEAIKRAEALLAEYEKQKD